jgi:hypothetical protein
MIMKIFNKIKMLALVAGMMMTSNANAQEVKKPDSGSILISKVYYAGGKVNGSNYQLDLYVELYNNTADIVDVSGMYLGLLESDAAASAYTAEAVEADESLSSFKGKAVLKQIFQLPGSTDAPFTLEPGKSILVCSSAIAHDGGKDLSGAEVEVKTTNSKYAHSETAQEAKLIYTYAATVDFMNLNPAGPASMVLLKNNASAIKAADEDLVFARGKDKGSKYALANLYYCVDAVDILANNKTKGIDATTKRFSTTGTYDTGYTSTTTGGTYVGETLYRKTAFITKDGRKVLYDTNNSSVDFQCSATVLPREYDEEVQGMTEVEITIPETGYLVFRPEKNVCAGDDVTFSYLTGNKKNSDLTYNEFKGSEELLAASNFIVVGRPGTHKVLYSEAQPTKKIPTNMLTWSEEDSKELTGSQATRSIYKWVNTAEKVGLQRVPATAEGKYNYATFSGEDRLYITLTADMVNAFYAANGADSAENFEFIVWHGSQPAAVEDIKGDVNGDELVNGTDIQAVINFIVAGEYDAKADVNEDGKVNGTDIQEIINIIVSAE